jgi:cytochrome c5
MTAPRIEVVLRVRGDATPEEVAAVLDHAASAVAAGQSGSSGEAHGLHACSICHGGGAYPDGGLRII